MVIIQLKSVLINELDFFHMSYIDSNATIKCLRIIARAYVGRTLSLQVYSCCEPDVSFSLYHTYTHTHK